MPEGYINPCCDTIIRNICITSNNINQVLNNSILIKARQFILNYDENCKDRCPVDYYSNCRTYSYYFEHYNKFINDFNEVRKNTLKKKPKRKKDKRNLPKTFLSKPKQPSQNKLPRKPKHRK